MTAHYKPRLKAVPQSVEWFKAKLRILPRHGHGRSLRHIGAEMGPVLRWRLDALGIDYFVRG